MNNPKTPNEIGNPLPGHYKGVSDKIDAPLNCILDWGHYDRCLVARMMKLFSNQKSLSDSDKNALSSIAKKLALDIRWGADDNSVNTISIVI